MASLNSDAGRRKPPGREHLCMPRPMDYNRAMRTTCSLVLCWILVGPAPALCAQNQAGFKPSVTSYVTCTNKAATSRTVDSDIFASPDGKRRSYAEVSAKTAYSRSIPEGGSATCINNSRLFVSQSGQPYELVFLQEPSDMETGNSLQVVDWSSDSRRLLVELSQWQYETPGVTRTPLVYQAELGVFQQPDLSRSFRREFGIDCSLDVHVTGFTAEGKIVIETEPLAPEEEEVLALPSCTHKKGQWLLNAASEAIAPLPENAKIVRNAKVEPPPK